MSIWRKSRSRGRRAGRGARSHGVIPNRVQSIRKLAGKQGPVQRLPKVRFEHPTLEAALADSLREAEHAADRIVHLEKAIDDVERHNSKPKPFIWTAKASGILAKVKRARKALVKVPSV